jgi:glycosyltransferase involved in cell wall biosynthesis
VEIEGLYTNIESTSCCSNHMDICVIIPLLNRGKYVARALNSVLAQSYPPIEIIVVDGGSSDDGPEIVKKYDDKRITLLKQSSKGVSGARNEGVKNSTAEFITFLDADDEWTPDHLKLLTRLCLKYPVAGLYASAYECIFPNNKHKRCDCYNVPSFGLIDNYFKSASRGEPPVWTSVTGLKRDIFWKLGGFKEGYNFGEDLDLWGRIALSYKIAFIDEIGGIYHQESENRLCQQKWLNAEQPFNESAIKAIESGVVPAHLIGDLNEYISRLDLQMVIEAQKEGKNEMALRRLLKIKTRDNTSLWIQLLIISILPNIREIMEKFKGNFGEFN